MKVVGAFFVVLGLVVFSGIVFSYFNDSILFSPDEKWTHIILTSDTELTAFVLFRNVEYRIELVSVDVNDIATFKVTNLKTGSIDEKTISEGQTKQIGDLRFKLIDADGNNEFYGAEFYVTGKIIDRRDCVEPPRGLVSWWDGSATNMARDIWDGNDGLMHKVNNGPGSGKVGELGFEFNGVDSWIQVPDADNLDVTSITIDAWVKRRNTETVTLISKGRGDIHRGDGFQIDISDKIHCMFSTQAGVPIGVSSTSSISYDEWTHIACVYDETRNPHYVRVYINGDFQASNSYNSSEPFPMLINDKDLLIALGESGYAPYSGLIDEVEIHNVALTEEEIKAIYDAGSFGKCKEETPTHTTCEENSCVVVEGEGSNECLTNEDCTHLECVANACQIVSGQGEDQCGPGKPPCGGEEWHYACVGNRGCVLTPGPGPDTCGPEELCPGIGNPGGVD